MKFGNTKWDVRDWTEEQKIQFQEKCFVLGYVWGFKGKTQLVEHLGAVLYYLNSDGYITYSDRINPRAFETDQRVEKTWEDIVPTPKLDVSKEIATLVFEALDKMEEEVIQEEDENGFEGLEYNQPDLTDNYYVVPLNCVSEEQLTFLEDNLDLHLGYKLSDNEVPAGLASLAGDGDWFFCTDIASEDIILSFNDLFQYKEV